MPKEVELNAKIKKWRKFSYLSVILFLFIALSAVVYLFYPSLPASIGIKPNSGGQAEQICPDCVRRLLDGVYVQPGEDNFYPLAAMIDNHPDARPVFGLSRAGLVYEAEAEGGITRYLAIFAGGETIEKIGPVRSVRPYFIDWAREFSALLIHCGGSPEALTKIIKDNIFDLNEFYNGSYFWRDKDRAAPHNIFTSSANLEKYLEATAKKEGRFLSWRFKDDGEATAVNEQIKISFKYPDFSVEWNYDIINNDYLRSLDGSVHKDGEGREIRAKNVIIQYNQAEVIDAELRLKMETSGSGRAIVCLDGSCRAGEWVKSSPASRTRYYYEQDGQRGEEVEFNAGKTWIEVVDGSQEVSY